MLSHVSLACPQRSQTHDDWPVIDWPPLTPSQLDRLAALLGLVSVAPVAA